jgi:hypothetical protein
MFSPLNFGWCVQLETPDRPAKFLQGWHGQAGGLREKILNIEKSADAMDNFLGWQKQFFQKSD